MGNVLAVAVPPEAITAFCRKWRVVELALVGSVLGADRGVEVLVTFLAGVRPGWCDRVPMTEELEQLFGRKVKMVERRLIEDNPDCIRRQEILSTAKVIYTA